MLASGPTRPEISAAKTHRVELANHPLNSVLAPERFAVHDERRQAQDLVAIGLGQACIQDGARSAVGIAKKFSGIEADLGNDLWNRVAAFDIEYLFLES